MTKKFKFLKLLLACLVLPLTLSCTKSNEEILRGKLSGQWAIEDIKYEEIDYKPELYINFIVLEENGVLSVPESRLFEKDYRAYWEPNSNLKEIKFKCKDTIVNGIYDLKFIKDKQKKLLGIELKSNHTHIKAFKFSQNYDTLEKDW